jgi:hypothetical protein
MVDLHVLLNVVGTFKTSAVCWRPAKALLGTANQAGVGADPRKSFPSQRCRVGKKSELQQSVLAWFLCGVGRLGYLPRHLSMDES